MNNRQAGRPTDAYTNRTDSITSISHLAGRYLDIKILYAFLVLFSGLNEIQNWNKESLKRRLHKSLSCDWMRTAHQFPLRKFYVELEWQRKVREALWTERIRLDSLHDLINLMTSSDDQTTSDQQRITSVIVEGKGNLAMVKICFGTNYMIQPSRQCPS